MIDQDQLKTSWLTIYKTAFSQGIKSKAVHAELSNHAAMIQYDKHESRRRAANILFSLTEPEIANRIKKLEQTVCSDTMSNTNQKNG